VLAGELNRAGQDYRLAYDRYEQLLRPLIDEGGPTRAVSLRRSRRKPQPGCGYATTSHHCWPSRTSASV
jgi:YD repeat-containing protein